MSFTRFLKVRYLAVLAMILILTASAFAFAASNVVPVNDAGDGQETISGYTVTDVTYALNATNPANIDSVTFTVTPSAGAQAPVTVKAQLVSSGSWFTCSLASGKWSCPVTGVTALQASTLRIVAAQ